MFVIKSEKELTDSFLPRDRRRLELPRNLKFPLMVRDYFAWSDPGSPRVFLLFSESGGRKPLGVVFDRDLGGGPNAAMCEWCHSTGTANDIGFLMLDVTERRRVGVHLCLDLSCRDKIENDLSLTPMAAQARTRRVLEEMSRFARRLVF